jgi:hypothetical protein
MRQRIDQVRGQMRREGKAAERPHEELSARHLDWLVV